MMSRHEGLGVGVDKPLRLIIISESKVGGCGHVATGQQGELIY